MGRRMSRRPSAAMVVAVVALSFALVGTAVAGPDALTSAITKSKVKKIAKKQAKKQINNLAGGLTVANATSNRASFVATEDAFVGNGTLLSTTITAPQQGTLLINANVDSFNPNGVDTYSCFVEINQNFVPGSTGFLTDGGSSTPEDDCGSVAAAVVPAGTHTVDWEGGSSFGDMVWLSRTLTVEFVPFNGAGATPAKATKSGGADARSLPDSGGR